MLPPGLWSNFSDETIGAVQWSHDESVLPEKVKAALENRQAVDQSQTPLPDATSNQQQVRARLVCAVMRPEVLFPCSLFQPKLTEFTPVSYRALSSSGSVCTLRRKEKPAKKIGMMPKASQTTVIMHVCCRLLDRETMLAYCLQRCTDY